MQIVTSWDDGCESDLRMAVLLQKYDLPGIFYIANKTNSLSVDDIRKLHKVGFEIGGHTVNHPEDMKLLTFDEQLKEIVDNKHWLEGIIDTRINSFCYPGGRFNDVTVEAVKTALFSDARTTNKLNIEFPTDPYRIAPTIHARPDKYDKPWLEISKEYFLKAKAKDSYYHIWGHSWEVDDFALWPQLEELFAFIYDENQRSKNHSVEA